jgi:hypothetical protein
MTAPINRRTAVSGLINEYRRAAGRSRETQPTKVVRALWHPTGTFVGKLLVQRHVRMLGPGPGSPGARACWSDQQLEW